MDKASPTDLFEQVPDSHGAADDEAHQVFGVELVIEQLCRHRHADSTFRNPTSPQLKSKIFIAVRWARVYVTLKKKKTHIYIVVGLDWRSGARTARSLHQLSWISQRSWIECDGKQCEVHLLSTRRCPEWRAAGTVYSGTILERSCTSEDWNAHKKWNIQAFSVCIRWCLVSKCLYLMVWDSARTPRTKK